MADTVKDAISDTASGVAAKAKEAAAAAKIAAATAATEAARVICVAKCSAMTSDDAAANDTVTAAEGNRRMQDSETNETNKTNGTNATHNATDNATEMVEVEVVDAETEEAVDTQTSKFACEAKCDEAAKEAEKALGDYSGASALFPAAGVAGAIAFAVF